MDIGAGGANVSVPKVAAGKFFRAAFFLFDIRTNRG
jgi:hypothetical protein